MVDTLTKVATSSITNTKLAIATLAALAASGAAFVIAPAPSPQVVDIAVKQVVVGTQNLSQSIPVTISYENRGNTAIHDVLCTRLEFRNNAGAVINVPFKYVAPLTGGYSSASVSGGAVCINRSGVPAMQDLAPGAVANLSIRIVMPTLVQSPPNRLTVKVDGGDAIIGGVLYAGKGIIKENDENNNSVTVDLPTPYSCKESDNGNDVMNFGTATENNNIAVTSSSVSDVCTASTTVTESYCVNYRLVTSTVACPTNYGCQSGSCVGLPDLMFNANSGADGKPPFEVDFNAGTLKINYYNAGAGNVPLVPSGFKLAWINRSGLALTPAVNPVDINPLISHAYGTATFALPTDQNTRSIYMSLDPYNAVSESIEDNNIVTTQFHCSETDGGNNPNVKSKIAGVVWLTTSTADQNRIYKVQEDRCVHEYYLTEFYCENNWVKEATTYCPGGCLDGYCRPVNFTCSEGDAGNDQYHAATTTLMNNSINYPVVGQDRCVNQNVLLEYYCTGNNINGFASTTIVCPSGCSMGACIKPVSSTVSVTITSSTLPDRIIGPGQAGNVAGKWAISATGGTATLHKITFQAVNPSNSNSLDTLGTFGSFKLYDGNGSLLGETASIAGQVTFNGLNVVVNSGVQLSLKADVNSSGMISSGVPVMFTIKSDATQDLEIISADSGEILNVNNINGLGTFINFAPSLRLLPHDAYPVIAPVSLGNYLTADSNVKILKFTVTNPGNPFPNPGNRDLNFTSVTIKVNVSGLASDGSATGSISNFKLYEANDAGDLGTYLANVRPSNSTILAGGKGLLLDGMTAPTAAAINSTTITFDSTNDQNSMLEADSFLIAPGSSRSFIVTADTTNILFGKIYGTITLSAKINGETGWLGNHWGVGGLQYYYTPAMGSTKLGPFTNSDSYPVTGNALSISL